MLLAASPDTQNYRLLYIAEAWDKEQLIAKFTRGRSIELYASCANHVRSNADSPLQITRRSSLPRGSCAPPAGLPCLTVPAMSE